VLAALVATAALPACGVLGGDDSYEVTAYFDRAVSVFRSSDVRVLGLPAGSVSDVEIVGGRVRVDMSIRSDVKIPVDATAQIVPQSLIGERYIQISPVFKEGMDTVEDGAVIERTVVPVEPDDALAALKEFLDSLDPDGLGELITNLQEDLEGNGPALNDALGGLADLVETFAEKDDALLRIVDSFDRLTATLVTREQQLGEVMDAFGQASQVLADERQSIEELVAGLADLSANGLALLGEHATELRADIETLAGTAATIEANLGSVTQLLASGPQLSAGIIGAYNEDLRALDLRNNFTPLGTDLTDLVLDQLGIEPPCVPVGQECPVEGVSAGTATTATIDAPVSPVGSLLQLLGRPTQPAPRGGPGLLDRVGGSIRDAATTVLGVGG
jgi:virulence factor Mce-like protein